MSWIWGQRWLGILSPRAFLCVLNSGLLHFLHNCCFIPVGRSSTLLQRFSSQLPSLWFPSLLVPLCLPIAFHFLVNLLFFLSLTLSYFHDSRCTLYWKRTNTFACHWTIPVVPSFHVCLFPSSDLSFSPDCDWARSLCSPSGGREGKCICTCL